MSLSESTLDEPSFLLLLSCTHPLFVSVFSLDHVRCSLARLDGKLLFLPPSSVEAPQAGPGPSFRCSAGCSGDPFSYSSSA